MHSHVDKKNGPVNRISIVVSNYHDGEYPIDHMTHGTRAHIRYLWDSASMEFFEYLPTGGSDLFERYIKDQLHPYELTPMEGYTPQGDLQGQYIYIVSGTPEDVLDLVWRYCEALKLDVAGGGPGADDGTYDYFPGAVEAVRQLVLGLIECETYDATARKYYADLVRTAKATHYEGNEEADDLFLPIPEAVRR